jgi:hypothetical protein
LFNWRPVDDIEQRTKQLRIEALESEKHTKQLESEFELLAIENRRLATLESRLVNEVFSE